MASRGPIRAHLTAVSFIAAALLGGAAAAMADGAAADALGGKILRATGVKGEKKGVRNLFCPERLGRKGS